MTVESLEARRLLAGILWNGDGGNNLWHNPDNWDLDRLPTAGDDVTIPASVGTVVFDGDNASIDSLNLASSLTIRSGTLTSDDVV
ncbi:MAG: hypothetical protein R3C05_22735 [Pirellulaceae bacterium]